MANYWRQRPAQVDDGAGVADFRTVPAQDTFEVDLLLPDVSVEDVCVLLGHGRMETKERYFDLWDLSQHDCLAPIVRNSHGWIRCLWNCTQTPLKTPAWAMRTDSVRADRPMDRSDLRPIGSSLPIVSAGSVPTRFRDCQGGCIWKSGSFSAGRSSGSPD